MDDRKNEQQGYGRRDWQHGEAGQRDQQQEQQDAEKRRQAEQQNRSRQPGE